MTNGLSPGSLFANEFEIGRQLSAGGMGEVYVVRQRSTGRLRALKVMHQHLLTDPQARQRFEREAQVASRIESEHVVEVVAAGVDPSTDEPWIAMELLEGETLAEVLRRLQRLSPAATRAALEGICHALAAAHRAGIVHRDLKPQNIFVARSKRSDANLLVKVLDFGIAMIAKGTLGARFTGEDMLGSPVWMAPEQFADSSLVSPQTDVWNLGLLVFALLTGKRFWLCLQGPGEPTAVMNEALLLPMPAAMDRARALGVEGWLSAPVAQWCDRCLQRDPRARFSDAQTAWTALASIIQFEPGALAELDALGSPRVSANPSQHSQPWFTNTSSSASNTSTNDPNLPTTVVGRGGAGGNSPSPWAAQTPTATASPWMMAGSAGQFSGYSQQPSAPQVSTLSSSLSRGALLGIVGVGAAVLVPLAAFGIYSLVMVRDPDEVRSVSASEPRAAAAAPTATVPQPPAPTESATPLSYQQAVDQTTARLQQLQPRLAACRTPTPQSGRMVLIFMQDGTCVGVTAIFPIAEAQTCLATALADFRGAACASPYSVVFPLETLGQ